MSHLGPKISETLPLDLKQTKLNQCENLKLKLRNGTSKLSLPILQDVLAKY